MGMHFSKAALDLNHDGKTNAEDLEIELARLFPSLDVNHDGEVNWDDFIAELNAIHDGKISWKTIEDDIKAMLTPRELALLAIKLAPIIAMAVLPESAGAALIIKVVISALAAGFSALQSSQQKQDAIKNLSQDDIQAVVTNVINNYNGKVPNLVDQTLPALIEKNPNLKLAVEQAAFSDPSFQKTVVEALSTPASSALRP